MTVENLTFSMQRTALGAGWLRRHRQSKQSRERRLDVADLDSMPRLHLAIRNQLADCTVTPRHLSP